MISIKVIIIPSVLRDVFFILLIVLFRPEKVFGNIFGIIRMGGWIPISKVENIPVP